MNRVLFLTGMMLGGVPLPADPPPAKAPEAGVPVLPLSIPGYELRVLDVRKPVVSDDLAKLGQKPEWTGEELRQVVAKLDAALGLLIKKS